MLTLSTLTANMSNEQIPEGLQDAQSSVPKTKEEIDYTKERDERCFKIAQEVMEVFTKHGKDIALQDMPHIKQKLIEYIQNFYFQLAIDHFEEIWNFIQLSIERHLNDANKILWEKEPQDVRIKDVENVLKKGKENKK